MSDKPLATVCLVAYNHERYIGQCIESLLSQRTSFGYVILAHDDASTDATAAILMEYAERYPGKVILQLEQENQYRKNSRIMAARMWPVIETEFTAVCEGDDYWTDPDKLETQVRFLREHPDYSLSVTSAETVDAEGKPVGAIAPFASDSDLPVEKLIADGGGSIATASVVTRTAYLRELPAFYYVSTVGDAPLQLYLAALGRTRWHANPMTAYRVNASGSWTVEQLFIEKEKRVRFHEKMIAMIEGFDDYTGKRYTGALGRAEEGHRFEIARVRCDIALMRSERFRPRWNALTAREKARILVMKTCPGLIRLYRRIRFGG